MGFTLSSELITAKSDKKNEKKDKQEIDSFPIITEQTFKDVDDFSRYGQIIDEEISLKNDVCVAINMVGLRKNLDIFNQLSNEQKTYLIANKEKINKIREFTGKIKCVELKDLVVDDIVNAWFSTVDIQKGKETKKQCTQKHSKEINSSMLIVALFI